MNKQVDTCCFTGHRLLPTNKIDNILLKLDEAIEEHIQLGIHTFISGGALGFDQMAASLISTKKKWAMRFV